jgi:hypothetical protein
MFRHVIIATGLAIVPEDVAGQQAPDTTLLEIGPRKAGEFVLDLNAPTDPGFVVVGASPKDFADPGNMKQFAIHTAGFVDDGKLKPGLAVSGMPYWWINRDLSMEQYANTDAVRGGLGRIERVFARTQVSLATVEYQDETGATGVKVGAGFQSQLLDSQDIRLDPQNIECVRQAWDRPSEAYIEATNAILPQHPDVDISTKFDAQSAELKANMVSSYDAAYMKCKQAAAKRFLAKSAWNVGFGAAMRSRNRKFGNLTFNGASFWSSYRAPLGENFAAVLFARGDVQTDYKLSSGMVGTANGFEAALALAIEKPDWKIDTTASYHYRDYREAGLSDENYLQVSATAAYKLSQGVWLEASAGQRSGTKHQAGGFGLLKLKMDLSNLTQ